MKIIQLNHVAIYVKDLESSIKFYGEIIGLPQIPRPAFSFPGAWFKIGTDNELHVIGHRTAEVIIHRSNHFAFKVDSIEAAEKHLKEKGVQYQGPKKRPDGIDQIFIQDPDGYWIELNNSR